MVNLTQRAMGATSEPCCISAPRVNQKEFRKVYWFSYSSGSWGKTIINPLTPAPPPKFVIILDG